MLEKLQGFLVQYVMRLEFIKGHRTYLGGLFFVLTGIGLYLNMMATGVFDQATMTKADIMIGAGLTAIGGAGKMDKLIEAQKKKE